VGGAGDDILWGGAGDDTFMWLDGDAGAVANPAKDIIKDFGMGGSDPNGNDKIDLADLLKGHGADLTDYLNFTFDGTNTVLKVSTAGDLNGTGTYDQLITLENVDLVNGLDNQAVIDLLRDQGKLIVDIT